MTWRDDKLPASLAGIPLHYQSVETAAGRRTFLHEFYGDSREAFVEDIGPVTNRAVINVFLIGDFYHRQRDALVDALNSKGPHEFVHPLRGSIMVRLGAPAMLNETVAEGGMVRIGSLDLIKAGLAYPVIAAETAPKLVSMAFQLTGLLAETTRLSAVGAIDPVRFSLLGALRKLTGALRKLNGRVTAQLNRIDTVSNEISLFEDQLDALLNTPNALMTSLTGLGLAVFSLIGKFQPDSRSIKVEDPVWPVVATAAAAVNDLVTFTTEPDFSAWVPDGPQKQLADEGHAEIQFQAKALGYVAGAGIAGLLPYASASEAGALLQTLATGLKSVMADPGIPSEVQQSMAELRTTAIRVLLDRQARLPRVARITTPAAMPAAVLAWELFGDANRTTELVLRNKIAHPSYVPAGTVLEVLVDA